MHEKENKNKSIMSIDLVIVRDHGKGSFRASININANFTSGRNITRVFRLEHVQCKKDNGDIMGNIVMDLIGDRLKNICAGRFIG